MRLFYGFVLALSTAALTPWSAPVGAIGGPGLSAVPCPAQEWEPVDPAFDPLPGARAFSGAYDGGVYRLEVPANWNGDLVLYAHGFRANTGAAGKRLVAPFPSTLREPLLARGYAWASSSYRCNGYVPGVGLEDTMRLREMVTKAAGRSARRVFLTGTSMGGHVTLLGLHEFPTDFAGGLAMCPAGPELFDFFLANAAAAEVVTGRRFTTLTSLADDTAAIAGALGTPAALTPAGRQLASVEIGISGGPRPFAVEGLASRLLQNISGGGLAGATAASTRAATNAHVVYTLDERLGLRADALNAAVRRKPADPSLRAPDGPLEELVPFDGRLERPLMTMHGTGDLFVPIGLERRLNQAVRAAGREQWLVQRIYRIAGHCQFTPQEELRAFEDLVRWSDGGAQPSGDDVMRDLRDAGRQFTTPLRPGDPGTLDVSPAP